MKKNTGLIAAVLLLLTSMIIPASIWAQGSKENKLIADSKEAKTDFITTDGLMQSLFDDSYGYVIFPNVGKGGIGIGGAAGECRFSIWRAGL
jgi:hypothetical protein